MKRIVGTIMALGGILVAPPLWSQAADGGLGPMILFAGAVASIATGLAVSLKGRTPAGGARRTAGPA